MSTREKLLARRIRARRLDKQVRAAFGVSPVIKQIIDWLRFRPNEYKVISDSLMGVAHFTGARTLALLDLALCYRNDPWMFHRDGKKRMQQLSEGVYCYLASYVDEGTNTRVNVTISDQPGGKNCLVSLSLGVV